MTRLDELEASIIASARRAMTPAVSVEERVRASTVAAIAASSVVAELGSGVGERLSTAVADALESMTEASTQARVLLGVAALRSALAATRSASGRAAPRLLMLRRVATSIDREPRPWRRNQTTKA